MMNNVVQFGAKGDGKTDDTQAFQNAIDDAAKNGCGAVLIPNGTYLIDPIKSVNLKSNVNLVFTTGASLIAKAVSSGSYSVINILDVSNVSILGSPTIVGERYKHLGTSGEWGMGINIKGSSNVYIENARITDCWGDGIYLGSSTKQNYNKAVKIVNPVLDNNRRQGISVISAINLDIENAVITNTNGTAPQSGIDFEPNQVNEYLQNITVSATNISNNKGYGILCYFGRLNGTTNPVSINIVNGTNIHNNVQGNIKILGTTGVKGKITVDGKVVFNQ